MCHGGEISPTKPKGQGQVIYLEQMFTFDLQVNNDIGSNYRNKYKTFIENVMGDKSRGFMIAQHQNIAFLNI